MKKILTSILLSLSALYSFDLSSMVSGTSPTSSMENPVKTKKTYESLIKALKNSANADFALYLGVLYLNGSSEPDADGKTIKPNKELAEKYIKKAINLENYKAAALLGTLFLFDDRFRKDPEAVDKARYYLTLAVKNGIYDATVALSSLYFYYDKDVSKGMQVLHLGADHNVAAAQLTLATIYGYGSKDLDIPQNKFLGNQFLEKACMNPKKPQKVKDFCNSDYVIKNKAPKKEGVNENK